jgi:hypothetical protein
MNCVGNLIGDFKKIGGKRMLTAVSQLKGDAP